MFNLHYGVRVKATKKVIDTRMDYNYARSMIMSLERMDRNENTYELNKYEVFDTRNGFTINRSDYVKLIIEDNA